MPLNRITADELLVAGINTGLATIFSGPVGGIIVGTTSLLSAIFSGRPEPIKQNVNLRVEPFIKNRRVYGYSRYDAWNIWAGTRTRLAVTPDGNIPTKFLDIYCHLSEGHMGEISGVFVNDEWVPLTRGIDGIYRVRPGSKYEKFLFVRTYLEPTRLPPYLKTNYIDSVTDKYSLEASFELRTTDYHSGHSFAVVTLSDREGDTNDKKEKLSWDNGVPTINFLGKGIRVPDLSNLTGSNVYTDNSVSIMYDVFKNMCGGDTGLFDQHTLFMSYNWALNKVYNEYGLFDNLGIRLTQGSLKDAFYTKYPMVSKRASFNGVIEYGESFLNLMKDFSVIMEGGFFVYGGKIHTYYGSKSWINPIKITEGDLENKSKNVAVDIIQRDIFNTAIARIDQSGPFDYKQLEAEFEDSPSISRDGQKNPKDFGTIRGVNDPFNLSRLLAQPIVSTKLYGKIIRGTFVGEKILRLKKDQKVIIDFPTKNITNQKATVQFVQFTTGQSATVIFKVSDEKEHTDDYKLPNRQSISNYPDAPEPPFDIVTNVVRSFESGQENLKISLSFKISGNTLRIIGSVKGSEKNDSIDWQTINSQEIQYKEILGIKRETEYTITLQSIGTNGLYSDIVSVTIDSSKDSTAPLAPAGVSTTSGAGYYTARWTDPTEEDYSYTNIYQGSQSDFVPASDNLVWSGSDQPSIITDRAVGTHYVKISHVDSSGNESLFSPTSVAVTALTITGNKFTISADTAGAPADTSGGNGDVHVDSDGVIYEKSGGTWTRVNISFVGSPGTKTTIGSTRPQMPATNDIHIDPNGDVQRYSGTRWVFVQNIKGAKGERGIGIYDPSNVPTTLFDGDLRVNRDGTVDRYNGTTWVSTGTDLSGGDGDPGDNAPITTAGSRPSDPGTGDLNVDTDGRVFRYDGSDWVYTNVNLKGPTTTAGSRPSNPNTGDLNVDTDGRVFRYSGTAWINTNIDLTGPESAKVYSGPISADSSPTVTGAPTGSVFVAADGRYWRYSGTSWVFQKDLTGVKGGKGDKGERGIGIYDPSNVPTTLFDGDLRVNRDGTVDRYNGTTWVSTGTDLSGGDGDPGDNAPITTAGSRPSDPGTGDLNVDTDGRVFRYDGSDWVYTNVNLKGPTTTAGSRPSNPNTGDLNVDTDGRVFRYSGTAWINTNIDLTGPESAKVYSGPISADSSPTVTGAPTGSVFVAADGRYWRYSGTSWVFQKDLTGVKGGKGDKGERGIGIYDPSNVPTTLFDGDLRVNRDGTVDRYNGTTWVSTGTDLSGGVGDNAPITTAGARPSDPGTGDLNVDTNGRVFRYSGTSWVYTNVNLKGPTTTAGARPSNPNTGDLNVDTDGRVFRYSGTAWVNTNIDLTGPESAKVYSGPISADSSPTVTGAPTGSVFVAADGRYWRYSGTSWVFQKDLTGVKGERGIGYYTASEVPSLSDRIIGDNRVNDNGRVDTWDGTDWQETGIDLTGPPNARVYSKNLTDGSNPTLADTGEDSEDDIIEGSAFFDTSDGRWWSWSGTAWTSNGTLKGIGFAEKAVYRVVSISTTVFVSPTVSGNMVYSPTAHTISNLPSGWFNNVPTYNHLTQKVIGSQSTCGTDGSVNVFSSPFIYTDDTDINIVYIRTDSDISTTLPSSESNRIPTGWSDLVPTGTQILWARDVIRPSGQIQWTYGRPYKVEGIDGIDGKSGMPGYSVTYLYNAIQDGSSVPNSSGEFRLQTSTNSSGLTSLLDMKSATILELSPPSNYTQNQSLAFLTNINAALNLNTVVVVFVSIFKWIAFTITSKSVTGTNLLLGISHFADVFATGANIGSSELVSIHLSYVSSAASPEQTKFSTPVLSGVLGNTQATLTWTGESSNPNADLEYKQSSQGDSQYINWPGTDTSPETITGLTNTTSYDFRVKYLASGTNLDSSYSNVVSLTPVAPLAAPITPVSPTLSTVGMGIRATIPLITGVEEWQFRWENSTSQGQLVNPESSAWLSSPTINITSEDSSPLVNGRRYFIQVRVRNTAGTSGWSSLSSVSYRPVPDEITTWSLSQTTDGFGAQRIQISATIPSNSNGWKVYRNQTGTFSETDRQYTFGSTVVDYTDFETSVGGTYYYWLRPINTSTDGPLTGRKTFTLSVSDPNPLEITKSSDIAKYFTADSISSNNAGTWIYDSSGSSASGNTGPGSNNVLGFMHTETSGANYNEGTWQDNGIAQFKSVPTKSNRILRLRVCVQGDFNDGTEGLRVQHRATGSGGWTTITTIRGWDLNNSYVSGSTFTDEGGTSQTVVAKGGWIDVDVSIPDTATQVRLFPRYILGQAGEFYQHDTALRSFQWRTGTAPIVVPKPGPITGFSTNNITSNSVGYSFSSPTTNSSIVTSYSVKLFQGTYSTSNHPTGSSEDTDTFNPSDTLSGSFTGLTPNTTYTIQYFASPVSGTSGLQNVRYVTFTTSQAVSSDTTPNSMNFSSSSRVGGNVSSGFPNTVSGLGSGVSVTCSLSASLPSGWSARYEKNGSWVNFSVTTSFSVTNGDTIRFGLQGVTTSGTATISYSIGSNPGISSSWIYSRDPDTTPNSFDLGSDSDVTTLDGVNSDTITIGGLTDGDSAAASWSVTDTVSNPVQVTARLNGATQSNSFSRPVTNGDKIYLRCVMFGNGIATIVLTIGGVSDTWVVTRTSDSDPTDPVDPPDPDPSDPVPDDTTPNSFDLGSDSDVTSSSSVDSDTFTVGGLTAGVSVPASWSVTDTVANPVQVTARLNGATQSNSFSRSVTNGDEIYLKCAMFGNGIATIVLTIGGVRDTWIVTRT